MKKPTCSIIVPCYNSSKYLPACLDSILQQTYTDFEVVIVNDGSTDDTDYVITPYLNNSRVKYIKQQNAGPAAARIKGVSEAKGEWIAFLDSDDYWDRDHLMLLLRHTKDHTNTALIYCGKKWVDINGNEILADMRQITFPSGWIFNDMFVANYISTTSVVLVKNWFSSRWVALMNK
jgi:glycosyltransferase involved in cell wall biosynthesis